MICWGCIEHLRESILEFVRYPCSGFLGGFGGGSENGLLVGSDCSLEKLAYASTAAGESQPI